STILPSEPLCRPHVQPYDSIAETGHLAMELASLGIPLLRPDIDTQGYFNNFSLYRYPYINRTCAVTALLIGSHIAFYITLSHTLLLFINWGMRPYQATALYTVILPLSNSLCFTVSCSPK